MHSIPHDPRSAYENGQQPRNRPPIRHSGESRNPGGGEGECSAGACPPLGSGCGATESIAPIRYTKPILIPWSAGDLTHANRTLRPAGVAAKLALYSAMSAHRITKPELAGRLGVSESAVRKLTIPDHRSPFSQIDKAPKAVECRTQAELTVA